MNGQPKSWREKFFGFLSNQVDNVLTFFKILFITYIQEVWRIGARTVTVFFAILLGFANKEAFQEWWDSQRSGRIEKRLSLVELDPSDEDPTHLGFETLLDEDTTAGAAVAADLDNPEQPRPRVISNGEKKRKFHILKPKTKPSIFADEKVATGLFEDIKESLFILIERCAFNVQNKFRDLFDKLSQIRFRKILFSLFGLSFYLKTTAWLLCFISTGFYSVWWTIKAAIQFPKNFRLAKEKIEQKQKARFDTRERKEILHRLGYPFQEFEVVTDDGYILRLERLPRPGSTKAIYFQHGVMDSAHAWLGGLQDAGQSTAFRAYEMGYDVWAGTLRGCGWDRKHINPNISNGEFWNFTVNEHAFQDLPAFIKFIHQTKNTELSICSNSLKEEEQQNQQQSDKMKEEKIEKTEDKSPQQPKRDKTEFKLTLIAHSMGAMASIMYTVYWPLKGLEPGIHALILLSPAGLHVTAPTLCKVTGPFLSWFFDMFPNAIYHFSFPSEIGRLLVAKMIEDVKHNYSLRNMFSFLTYKFLGGEKTEHAVTQARNLTYNIFAGTSVGIFKHFWQNWTNQTFECFDYGVQKNLEVYGTTRPIDIIGNFDKIKIPTFFVIGLRDSLIEPVSILKQYETLAEVHPELAHVRAFPRMGHIDLTLGENTMVTNYLIETMETINGEQKKTQLETPKNRLRKRSEPPTTQALH